MARGKRKDGRLVKKITVEGKAYYIYGKTASEIIAKEAAKREEIATGFSLRNDPTVSAYFDKWLENMRGTISDNSIYFYESQLRKLRDIDIPKIDRTFGELKLKEVVPDDMKLIQSVLSESLVSTSVNHYMRLVKRIFKEAMAERIIEHNPCDLVRAVKRTEERARDTIHRALTREETKAFFDSHIAQDSIYYNVFRLALNTGMRVGEIGALKSSDIYDDMIHIERTVTRNDSGVYVIGDSAKTKAGHRTIPLNDNIRQILEDQKKIKAMLHDNIVGIDDPMRGILFKSSRGEILRDQTINEEIRGICAICGIQVFTMHAFRDTFATRAIESGIEPKTLQEIMGHSNIAITLNLYAHVMDETKQNAMQKIDVAI